MMHRVAITHNPAVSLQNAAEQRRTLSNATSASTTTAAATAAAAATAQPAEQYTFAEIFGAASDQRGETSATATAATSPSTVASPGGFSAAIATATATVVDKTAERSVVTDDPTAGKSASTTSSTADTASTSTASTQSAASTESTGATAASTTATSTTSSAGTGIEGLVTAIMNGTFQATYVTSPSQLQEINPAGTDYMPNFYYASDQTAAQLASILGGTVVKMPPFGQDKGWTEPDANFIQLPNGQTFNAADVAYYAKTSNAGPAQLTADITATINEGAAWTNYYQTGGSMPTFPEGYVGPPIAGMTYPTGTIDGNGNVINPAMQSSSVQGT
jgi:hypothetical protein